MSVNNNSGKLKRYYKRNIARIFLCGILFTTAFMAIHVVSSSMDSQKFSIKYKAYINSTYTPSIGAKDITTTECMNVISNGKIAEDIKYYLGSYVTYEEFLDNISFQIKDRIITTYYTDESQVRAKRLVNTVTRKLNNYLIDTGRVEYISKSGETYAEETKVLATPKIKLGMLYFAELGFVLGCVVGCVVAFVIYFINGRIKTKHDVEDELHIAVLTEIQYVEDLAK